MAWRAGNFILTEGASVKIEFNWQGAYKGTQFALARPVMDLGPFVGEVTGERTVDTTNHGITGRRRSTGVNVDWIYHVTVQNLNTDAFVLFELMGGEVAPNGT
jgi:hypothetical protein